MQCSQCKHQPHVAHVQSGRYRGARFCSPECKNQYETRRDRYRGLRRVLKWVAGFPDGILEFGVSKEDLLILEDLRKSKLVERIQKHNGPIWSLTQAGWYSASFQLVQKPNGKKSR